MKKILRLLKRVWFINFIRRFFKATKYYNKKYLEILKWGILSREDTNHTYNLTESNIKYLAHFISVVTDCSYNTVLEYINEAENDFILKEEIKITTKNSSFKKITDYEARYGRRLGWYAIIRITKPGVVVETGVDKGLGAILICAALLRNRDEGFDGRYFGTDINTDAGFLLTGKYKEVGKILYGDSLNSLSSFNDNIDLFINDSNHSSDYEYQEYCKIKHLITDNTIIIGDNSHASDKLAMFSHENNRNFLFFKEEPKNHWYPGAGIGISFKK